MREGLAAAILKLPDRERLVMTLYYYEESTMKEIGHILGVSNLGCAQIHTSAVLHLRARLGAPGAIEESRDEETLPERLRKRRGKWRTGGLIPPELHRGSACRET